MATDTQDTQEERRDDMATETQETTQDTQETTEDRTQDARETTPESTPKSPKGQIHEIRALNATIGTIRNRRDAFRCARFVRDGSPESLRHYLTPEETTHACDLLGTGRRINVEIIQYVRDPENPESRSEIEETFQLSPRKTKKTEEKGKGTQEGTQEGTTGKTDSQKTKGTTGKTDKKTNGTGKQASRLSSSQETHQSAKRAA